MVLKIIFFVLGTGFLIYVSRSSLREPHSHGFFRFFAWEAMLILFTFNAEHWFENPFSWYQCIAWTLLFLCIVPGVWGAILLRKRGSPGERQDSSLLEFEKTTQLVTSGIYHYIRHPLYSSLLLLVWGIFFKLPSWFGGALAAATTAFLFLTARADESECIHFFGPIYEQYMKRTKRFIPFIF